MFCADCKKSTCRFHPDFIKAVDLKTLLNKEIALNNHKSQLQGNPFNTTVPEKIPVIEREYNDYL